MDPVEWGFLYRESTPKSLSGAGRWSQSRSIGQAMTLHTYTLMGSMWYQSFSQAPTETCVHKIQNLPLSVQYVLRYCTCLFCFL